MLKKFLIASALINLGQIYSYIRVNQTANTLAKRDGKEVLVIRPKSLWDYREVKLATDPNETTFHRTYL